MASKGRAIEFLLSPYKDSSGALLTSGTVYVYKTGTSTKATLYTTRAIDTSTANPFTLDGSLANAVIFLDGNDIYDIVIKDAADDATIKTYTALEYQAVTDLMTISAGSGTPHTGDLYGATNDLRNWSNATIGTDAAPLGTLYVNSTASGQTPSTDFDEVTLDNTGNTGMSIFSGATSKGGIAFGDSGDNDIGQLVYDHQNDTMDFVVAAEEVMNIDNNALLNLISTDTGTTGPRITMRHNPSDNSQAINDIVGSLLFTAQDDGQVQTTYGEIDCVITDETGGTEDGRMDFNTIVGSTETTTMSLGEGNAAVGTTSMDIGGTQVGGKKFILHGASGALAVSAIGTSTTTDNAELGYLSFFNSDNSDATAATGAYCAQLSCRMETSDSNAGDDSGGHLLFHTKPEAGTLTERMRIASSGAIEFTRSTEDFHIIDAGSTLATQQDWVEVKVGGVTGYIHIYSGK